MFEFVAQSSFKKNFDLFLHAFDDCEGILLHFPILFKESVSWNWQKCFILAWLTFLPKKKLKIVVGFSSSVTISISTMMFALSVPGWQKTWNGVAGDAPGYIRAMLPDKS